MSDCSFVTSRSIVPGGCEATSWTMRLIPRTSLIMRVAAGPRNSCGNGKWSADAPSIGHRPHGADEIVKSGLTSPITSTLSIGSSTAKTCQIAP